MKEALAKATRRLGKVLTFVEHHAKPDSKDTAACRHYGEAVHAAKVLQNYLERLEDGKGCENAQLRLP